MHGSRDAWLGANDRATISAPGGDGSRPAGTIGHMRRFALGLLLATGFVLPACGAQSTARRELEPLPGVTTPSTLLAPSTVPGDPSAPGTTLAGDAVTTPAPPSTAPAAPTSTGPRWVYGDFRSVPQLGSEPVSGSGCGADGTIGERLPDGWWLGIVTTNSGSQLQFDLVCAYSGTAAQTLIDECLASITGSTCTQYFNNAFWPVNRNTRERSVPISAALQTEAVAELCNVGIETRSGGITAELDWLLVEGGSAVYLRRGCGSE